MPLQSDHKKRTAVRTRLQVEQKVGHSALARS